MANDGHEVWIGEESATPSAVRILLYSDHSTSRAQVRSAIGTRPAADLPPVVWVETATAQAALDAVRAGGLDLIVLDGEAGKTGGMAVARQLRDEGFELPPILLIIARAQDAWLASWSEADEVVAQPLDPFHLAETVAGLLRKAGEVAR